MICSSEKRFFTSNLLGVGNWTPNRHATQNWGDVGGPAACLIQWAFRWSSLSRTVLIWEASSLKMRLSRIDR
ncbi:hypothetical protein BRN52_06315 [Xanthomonas oryzae pv. oryzae]|nr:hypothetical protein BRN52_06315 [Xanthomonas oryzae pv. oryzae]PUE89589.1 hypothetical protein C7T79_22360 [Xanthomonas oryzae pv. oryzicola]RBB63347.1 hypothetical protein BRN54_20945 [Xanthomonas oryzae pv. oryzae]RBL22940.1 hypothetical protein BRN31_18210 [Xanthomonas oryzae pv. oryzae]RBL60492.1 hypothetical protein BRN24_12430 [Xanthomonas oryzae pv. oryzae]